MNETEENNRETDDVAKLRINLTETLQRSETVVWGNVVILFCLSYAENVTFLRHRRDPLTFEHID